MMTGFNKGGFVGKSPRGGFVAQVMEPGEFVLPNVTGRKLLADSKPQRTITYSGVTKDE